MPLRGRADQSGAEPIQQKKVFAGRPVFIGARRIARGEINYQVTVLYGSFEGIGVENTPFDHIAPIQSGEFSVAFSQQRHDAQGLIGGQQLLDDYPPNRPGRAHDAQSRHVLSPAYRPRYAPKRRPDRRFA